MSSQRKAVVFLLLLSVPFSGCGSVIGRSECGPQLPVYSGVALDAWEISGVWRHGITEDTAGTALFFLIDFPVTLAVDTAIFPVELTIWAFSSSEPEQQPTETPEPKAPEPKTPPPETPESIAHRWSVLHSLDGLFFFDKALGHGALAVRCRERRVEIRPTRPAARAPSGWETVPIETDGDAADFYFRVTSRSHPTLQGDLSKAYKEFLERRRQ